MVNYYDEIEIEDMQWSEERGVYTYPCPCGDKFEISRAQLADGFDQGICPSCSLVIRIIFDQMDFEEYAEEQKDEVPTENIKPSQFSAVSPAIAVAA